MIPPYAKKGDMHVRPCKKGEPKKEGDTWCLCNRKEAVDSFATKQEAMQKMHEPPSKEQRDRENAWKLQKKFKGGKMSAPKYIRVNDARYTVAAADEASSLKVDGIRYRRVDAAHPIEDTEGVPLSDVGTKGDKAVQKAIKDSRSMYFTQKGSDKKKPKETGINPDRNGPPPHMDGGGDGGDGGGDGGDGGGGE